MKFILMDLEPRDERTLVTEAESQRRVGKHQAALVGLTMQRSAANRSHLSIGVGLPPTDESQSCASSAANTASPTGHSPKPRNCWPALT